MRLAAHIYEKLQNTHSMASKSDPSLSLGGSRATKNRQKSALKFLSLCLYINAYGIVYHRMKAAKVFHEKFRTVEGVIVELKVFRVPKSGEFPEGYKYSFFAVFKGEVLVGYDNHHPKGHHRHLKKIEIPYEFSNLEQLKDDFTKDLNQALKILGREK